MNKAVKIILCIFTAAAVISSVCFFISPYDTESANIVTVLKTVTGSGFILRNETLVVNELSGVFEPLVKDGVRVSRGSSVGTVISGNLNRSLAEKLESVSARIDEIKSSDSFSDIYASDDARLYSFTKELCTYIRENAGNEDFEAAEDYKNRLNAVIDKKYSGETATARDSLLVELEDEKYSLEQQLGGIRAEITAPAAGIFYTALDGLERQCADADMKELKTSDINGFSQEMESFKNESGAVAKISDTYYWYLAANIPDEDVKGLSEGQSVLVSIDEMPSVSAVVLSLKPDTFGETAIVLKSSKNVKGITEKRTAEFEIQKENYSGIYVPAAAIRVVDDVTGVYTINENRAVFFRAVDVLARESDHYIVRTNYTPPEGCKYKALSVYDNILVNPEAVKKIGKNK